MKKEIIVKKKIIVWSLIFVILFSLIIIAVYPQKASKYTEEEHLQRVSERIEKRFITDETEYTGFEVYPLYNENDELNYILVEFEPYGYLYVLLRDEQLKAFSFLGASTSMYKLSNLSANRCWSPYTIDESNSQPYPDNDKCYTVDDNEKRIIYNRSPFYIAGIENEHRYLLHESESKADYVPAVKIGENYKNLISMDEVIIIDGNYTKKQATIYVPFIMLKSVDL
ncbi:MAG: hypothetical protein WCR54_05765 [Clostridia bacterium]